MGLSIISVFVPILVLILAPPISKAEESLELTPDAELQQLIEDDGFVIVLLSPGKCEEICSSLENTLTSIREDLVESLNAWVVRAESLQFATKFGLVATGLPAAVVYIRKGVPVIYPGDADDDEAMFHFFQQHQQSSLKTLNDDSFEHDTQASSGATTGDWLVFFTKEDCSACQYMQATIEAVASVTQGKKNIAVINRDTDGGKTTRRFGIKEFPSFVLFRLGSMYKYELPVIDALSLAAFVNNGFRNAKAEPIPQDKSPFDDLTEQIADWLKENPSVVQSVGYSVLGLLALVLIAVLSSRKSKSSDEDEGKDKKSSKKEK